MMKYLGILLAAGLGGCGTAIPDFKEAGEIARDQAFRETHLVNRIKCEIHHGSREAIALWKNGGRTGGNGADWLATWQAKVSLKLSIDDTGSFNPGASFMQPMENAVSFFRAGNVVSPQSFVGTIGLQASSQAIRTETIAFTYHIGDLLKYDGLKKSENCDNVGKIPINGDLKIADFIIAKTGISANPDAIPNDGKRAPFSVFSYQATFIVTTGASATPVWKLVNITSNAGNPTLLSAVRKRTHDITITMGPANNAEVSATYQANLIGQAVQSAIERSR